MYPQNASWSILTQPCSLKIQGSSSTEGCNRYFWGRCVGDMEAQRFPQREQLVFFPECHVEEKRQKLASGRVRTLFLLKFFRRRLDRLYNVDVPRAPAQVALYPSLDLLLGWIGVPLEKEE